MTLISPGIEVREIDLTTIVPAVQSTIGAIAGCFRWGPVEEAVFVSSEVDLVNRFGTPIVGWNQETFFTAADFLAYSDALFVSRASDGVKAFAEVRDITSNTDVVSVQAKYPGDMGNGLVLHVFDASGYYANTTEAYVTDGTTIDQVYQGYTYSEPLNNDFHAILVDESGEFSGQAGTVLESYEDLSPVVGTRDEQGNNKYFISVINDKSNYIEIPENFDLSLYSNYGYVAAKMGNGTNGNGENTISLSALRNAYDIFDSADNIDISILLAGKARGDVYQTQMANYLIDNIAHQRKDVVVCISPNKEAVVDNNTGELTDILVFKTGRAPGSQNMVATPVTSSSYAVIDTGYKYRYDRYNDTYCWVPLNGDIGGLMAYTDDIRDPWWSPAGYNRGLLKNVVKLAYNPRQAERDLLYQAGVNPVITQTGQGTLLFGDKTGLSKPSAFDRINVRRLFIVLEKAIKEASRQFLFEFNDTFTRQQFVNIVEPYLRDVQGRRGIYDFRVVCDETNNTPEIIDRNQFVGDIYIKPARSINFIRLNFIAVRTGVEFSEIVGNIK